MQQAGINKRHGCNLVKWLDMVTKIIYRRYSLSKTLNSFKSGLHNAITAYRICKIAQLLAKPGVTVVHQALNLIRRNRFKVQNEIYNDFHTTLNVNCTIA